MKDRRVNTGKDATLAEKRKNNITVIRALISHEFVDGGNIADIYSHPTTIDIEAIIRRTEIELPSYELKQGILRLTDERELDHDALDRIIQTVAAIANNGQNLSGKIIASSLSGMDSHDLPLLGQPCLPTSSCFFVRLTTRRFFVPA